VASQNSPTRRRPSRYEREPRLTRGLLEQLRSASTADLERIPDRRNITQWSTERRRREVECAAIRATEIIESFGMVNRRLCDELLDSLGRLGPEELYQLFGRPQDQPPAEQPVVATRDHEPAEQRGTALVKPRDPHANWRWDERGNRISPKLRSAFDWTRNCERPPTRRSHWSD
jgi:hypothetical protein